MSNTALKSVLALGLMVLSSQSFASWSKDCQALDSLVTKPGFCESMRSLETLIDNFAPPNPCLDTAAPATYSLGVRADCKGSSAPANSGSSNDTGESGITEESTDNAGGTFQ